MTDPHPHEPSPTPSPSLFDRLSATRPRRADRRAPTDAAAEPRADRAQWAKAVLLFLLLIAGPLIGTAINRGAAAADRRALDTLAATTTSQEAASRDVVRGAAVLAAAIERPAPTASIARIAAVLPGDDRIVDVAQRDGLLSAEIATADPDRLRGAIRRDPALAVLRETGQRQGDGVLLVMLGERE